MKLSWPTPVLSLAIATLVALGSFTSSAAERVLLHMPGGKTLNCDVLKVSSTEVHVKPVAGEEQTFPLALLQPKEVATCYHQVLDPNNAALRFEMGVYFVKKELYQEAKTELTAAGKLDATLKARSDAILMSIPSATVAAAESKKPSDSAKTSAKTPEPATASNDPGYADSGKDADFRKRFARRDVPARTDAQMKTFLDTRLDELNKQVGGKWHMIETKHFYCFANINEHKHNGIAKNWNEALYDTLVRVLRHKEGDKLWNNKMPIYYFETFKQFQKFAVAIDKSPGAAYSGGYFSADGREVHICIPFMSERLKDPEKMDGMARSTLFHEGTHAFLQLSGEDVHLSRWLHEGMAQFIEFLAAPDPEKNPEKKTCINTLRESVQFRRSVLDWDQMQERPMGGTDSEGYAYAYSRLEFLYRNSGHECLPQMIRLIKSGKSEAEAMETVFKRKVPELENIYKDWVKAALKINFNFPQ